MARYHGILKTILRPVAESIRWNRLRLVYWPRITAPFDNWRFNRILKNNRKLMMARRRRAWELMHREDLPPEKRDLAQRYYELNQQLYESYQEMLQTLEKLKKAQK